MATQRKLHSRKSNKTRKYILIGAIVLSSFGGSVALAASSTSTPASLLAADQAAMANLNSAVSQVQSALSADEAYIATDTTTTLPPVTTTTAPVTTTTVPVGTTTTIPTTGTYTPDLPAADLSQISSTPTFSDDFAGTTLNASKWNDTYQGYGGSVVGVSTSASNVTVDNGLTLKLSSSTVGADIDTHGKFSFKYGYLQTVMTLPGTAASGVYNWGGLYSASYQYQPNMNEIDLNESLNQYNSADYSLHASPRTTVHGTDDSDEITSASPAGQYAGVQATYGELWNGDTVTFFINGVQVEQFIAPEYTAGSLGLEIYLCEGQGEQYAGETVVGASIHVAQVAYWPLAS